MMLLQQVLGTLLLQTVDSAGCCWSSCVPPLLFSSPSSHPLSSTSVAEGKVVYISLLTVIFCILRTPQDAAVQLTATARLLFEQ